MNEEESAVILNTICWKIASALGDVPPGVTEIKGDPITLVDRILADREHVWDQAARAIESPDSLLCDCESSDSVPTNSVDGSVMDHHCDCPAVLAAGQILGDINKTYHYTMQCRHGDTS